jgi:hypothetical protein
MGTGTQESGLLRRLGKPGLLISRLKKIRGRYDDYANALAISVGFSEQTLKTAHGFVPSRHIAQERIKPWQGSVYIGVNLVDCPATVVAQGDGDAVRVLASFASEGASLRRHFVEVLRPWLSQNIPSFRTRLIGTYEQLADKQAGLELSQLAQEILGGTWQPSDRSWDTRKELLLDLLGKACPWTFGPALTISPDAKLLIESLSGRWKFERDRRDRRDVWWFVANAFGLAIAKIQQDGEFKELKPPQWDPSDSSWDPRFPVED